MSTHTPGPWVAGSHPSCDEVVYADREVICECRIMHEYQGNARLIAAAPELLATLINLEHAIDLPWDSPTLAMYRVEARAIVAKATGAA